MRRALAAAPAFAAVVALSAVVAAAQVRAPASPAGPDSREDGGPASIEVTPHVESLMERGSAQRFRAVVRDQQGRPLEDATVAWSVTPRVGTIDASGLFVATTACLSWDGIGIVTATIDPGIPGQRRPSDGALVVVHYDPTCLPSVPTSEGDGQR